MRLLMYEDAGGARLGALEGDQVVELEALAASSPGGPLPSTLLELIDLGEEGLHRTRVLLGELTDESRPRFARPLAEIRLLPPLDPPRENVLAIGRNYQEHAEESARARGEGVQPPTVFTKAQTSINAPHGDVPLHADRTSQLDWEAELGVVIGRRGRDIPPEQALDHVFGYTVVNDVSARDIQHNWGGQFFKGKSLDGCCPIGPWIVTADEVPDPQNLRVTLRVNGVTKQDANTRDMIHSVAELIARLSEGITLLPGNLIATGTPAGVGMGRTPQEWLKAGDVMETEIEGIGLLRNRIVAS
jgi:2-keto-4-pentenoate hydratase/2-oxohepta-3-ene-1,7-dioic acid hydratase in catechol pathway